MAASKKLSTSVPALQQQVSNQAAALTEARAENRRLHSRIGQVIADAGKRAKNFARYQLPTIGLYGGLGFGAGAGLAWFLYGYLTDWFGTDSYIPGLVFVGAGVALFTVTPSLVRVTVKTADKSAPLATGLYGASVGIAAYGLYEAYMVYSKPAAP